MEKKIIIAFGCGLGNQMFQYVFYHNMKERFPDYKVLMEDEKVLKQQHNGYELDKVFGIKNERCAKSDLKGYRRHIFSYNRFAFPYNFLMYIIRSIRPNPTFFKQENYTEYYPEVYGEKNAEKYLYKGIWANEKYFKNPPEEVRKLFHFKQVELINRNILSEIERSDNSVSIHFRRGDYVTEGWIQLGDEYYPKCIDMISQHINNPEYFVFSDDVDAAKEYFGRLNIKELHFIEGNSGNNCWMDMYLMSKCRHHIISNSSFSFWGAYLSENDGVVISPSVGMNSSSKPFVCEGWKTI